MTSRQDAIRFSALVLIFLSCTSLRAHDFWLESPSFSQSPGTTIAISLREGVDFKGNTLPYIPEWFRDFSIVTSEGREQVDSIPGDDPAALLAAPSGAMLVGYHSNRNYTELDAEKFNSYLEEEGIEFIRQQRIERGEDEQPAPEFFVRCAKALFQNGPSGAPVYSTELGYTLELIPVDDPHMLVPGDSIRFKLHYRRKPIAGLLVQAFNRDDPEAKQRIRTDESGVAEVKLDSSGIWLIKAVNIQPIIGDPKAKWQSYWASFVFELGEAQPAG